MENPVVYDSILYVLFIASWMIELEQLIKA